MGVVFGIYFATADTKTSISGNITNIYHDGRGGNNTAGSIMINGVVNGHNQNVSVKVTKDTQIFLKKGNDRQTVTFETLQVGQKVEIKITGSIIQTYPPQATALEILILE
ncbi:MAG: hypothetical protein FJ150_04810 [Euryarchaeota archaeon]|nr:hypothetical protein [Euryarchaeota archaeon]